MLKNNLSAQLVSAEGNGMHRKMLPFSEFISLQQNEAINFGGIGGRAPKLRTY